MRHKFYITNNLGGGGTNVSRFIDYQQLFKMSNIGLLLNYYYLKGLSNPVFDRSVISQIDMFKDIVTFLNFAKGHFSTKRNVSSHFTQDKSNITLSGYMLDNGCGNIIRDLIKQNQLNNESIQNIVSPFLDFAERLNFDFSIALDYAKKYTYKGGETADKAMQQLWDEVVSDAKMNLSLLQQTLIAKKQKNYKKGIYAPLHGFNNDSFVKYLEDVKNLENIYNETFTGFALGGIADTRSLDDSLWGVPTGFKKEMKTGYIVSQLCKRIKECDSRPLHVLGAGNIYILPFIINAGASSSDCHSAWRRASDGGFNKAKVLVPLFNDKLEYINDKNALKFVHIKDLDDSVHFNDGITAKLLKKLYSSSGEDFYYGEILTFYIAMQQYDLMIKYTETYDNYIELLCSTPDINLSNDYKRLAAALNI